MNNVLPHSPLAAAAILFTAVFVCKVDFICFKDYDKNIDKKCI